MLAETPADAPSGQEGRTEGGMVTPAARPGGLRRALQWISGADRIAAARAAVPAWSKQQLELRRRAKLACELAERVIDKTDPVRLGSPAPAAAELYAAAIYWALLADQPALGRPGAEALWQASGPSLARLGYEPAQLQTLKERCVTERPFVDFADLDPADQPALLFELRELAQRLLAEQEAPKLTLQLLLAKRVLRIALLVLAVVGLAAIAAAIATQRPDLARGKPWRTSSTRAVCQPEHGECAGAQTTILFHTNEEPNPWFEYDLGAPLQFSAMSIRNRTDGSGDRALPLVVEVSNDHASYREIARRTEPFRVWRPKFSVQHARFVRLRVPRVTFLHLEQIQVHP
jgi:hypothetical protein